MNPRIITLSKWATCAETGRRLAPGSPAIYYPNSRKTFAMGSEQYQHYLTFQQNKNR